MTRKNAEKPEKPKAPRRGESREGQKFIRETDAEAVRLAKTLIRTARHGALAVLDPDDGGPAASRVAVATNLAGAPLILVSTLSAHTRALMADPAVRSCWANPAKAIRSPIRASHCSAAP